MSHSDMKVELDKVIGKVFQQNETFLANLMCNLDIEFDDQIKTAAANGKYIKWNPEFFMSVPQQSRVDIMLHELWHIARLHGIRRGIRDPYLWNIACDVRINNDMIAEGYMFEGANPCKDIGIPSDMPEEDIYDKLIKKAIPIPTGSDLINDMDGMTEMSPSDITDQIQAVQRAIHQTVTANGNVPGGIKDLITKFVKPVIPWTQVLRNVFTDLAALDYSWQRPNRRFSDVYLPSMQNSNPRLAKINIYEDTSGSISLDQQIRFNSELKFIKETFQPEQINIVLFDCEIHKEISIKEHDNFNKIEVIGGGGTSLVPVREHILKTKPSVAIVFSDLFCTEMDPIIGDTLIIWVILGNPDTTPKFGKSIHIKE